MRPEFKPRNLWSRHTYHTVRVFSIFLLSSYPVFYNLLFFSVFECCNLSDTHETCGNRRITGYKKLDKKIVKSKTRKWGHIRCTKTYLNGKEIEQNIKINKYSQDGMTEGFIIY